MDRNKILIGVVILLVVLFVVAAGAGIVNGQDKGKPISMDNPLVSGFGNLLGSPPRLAVGDLTAPSPPGCVSGTQLVIVRTQSCTYTIGQLPGTRWLIPQIVVGSHIRVDLRQPDSQNPRFPDERMELPVQPDHADHVDVYKEGGTLQITCLASSQPTCRLTLAQ